MINGIVRKSFFLILCPMRKWVFTFLFSYFLSTSFAQSNIDVLHYKFEIELNDQTDTIYGKTTIIFISKDSISFSAFDLANRYKSKGMILTGGSMIKGNSLIAKISHEKDKLIYYYQKTLLPDDTIKISVSYKGIPSDGLIISKNKFGDRTFFADNWPDRAHNWIPCVDNPADKASFEFIITAPSQYQVISNGEKVEEKDLDENRKLTHWKEDISLSTKIMVIGVAKFAVKEFSGSPQNIPISAWVYPKDSVQGFKNYSVAPDIIKFYSSYVGPYPYNKLANVQSTTIYGGMENASAIFYNEQSASSVSSVESLLAHEIAHQWFGDMISEKKFAHLWLSEGFATYLQHLYTEKKYGNDRMKKEMKEDREQVIAYSKESKNPVVDFISPYRALLNPNSYQKGSWVLHMLRNQVGDSVFKKIIQTFYDHYKGKNADTKDFETIVEEITKKNWKKFFDQWLYVAAIPDLEIYWSYSAKKKMINIKINQKQDVEFDLPIELSILDRSGNLMFKKLQTSQPEQIFSIPFKTKPLRIEIDPNMSLLYSGFVKEMKN
jgi:aminopeptidase N